MHRAKLTEVFHGEGGPDELEGINAKGNELLTTTVKGGTLQFLTSPEESDDDAIKRSHFVIGEIEMEDGKVFSFWLSDDKRGAITETAVYKANKPQTG